MRTRTRRETTRSLPTKQLFSHSIGSYRHLSVLLLALSSVAKTPNAASDMFSISGVNDGIFLRQRKGQRQDLDSPITTVTNDNSIPLPSAFTAPNAAASNTRIPLRQRRTLDIEEYEKREFALDTAAATDSLPIEATVSSYEEILAAMIGDDGVWRRPRHRIRRIQEEETQNSNSINKEEGSASTTTEAVHGRLSKAIIGIVMGLGIVATLMSLGSCLFIYRHRKNKLIAIGQPPCEF